MSETTSLGGALVKIGGDTSPLMQVLSGLAGQMAGPLSRTSDHVRAYFGTVLEKGLTALLPKGMGEVVASAGNMATQALAGGVEKGTQAAGQTLGGLVRIAGSAAAAAVSTTTRTIGGIVGAAGEAVKSGSDYAKSLITGTADAVAGIVGAIPFVGGAVGGVISLVGKGLGGAVSLLGGMVGSALSLVGGGITKIGDLAAGLIQGVTGMAAGIIETVVPLVGGVAADLIRGIGGKLADAAGGFVNAVVGPVRRALEAPLTDLGLWVNRGIEIEASMARFEGALKRSGGAAGWTSAQLQQMQQDMKGMFDDDDIREAQTGLLRYRAVAGETFREVLRHAQDLVAAGAFGSLKSAAQTLGLALSNPEAGFKKLRKAGIAFSQQEKDQIKTWQEAGQTAKVQGAILAKVASMYGGAAEAMANTTKGKLAHLKNAWEDIGENIGVALAPLTGVVADFVMQGVRQLDGILGPIFGRIGEGVQGVVANIRGWIEDNKATFEDWGNKIGVIADNVVNLVVGMAQTLLSNLNPEKAGQFWEGFKAGANEALSTITAISTNWSLVKDAAEVAWTFIKNTGLDIWEAFQARAAGVWEDVKAMAKPWFDDLLGQGKLWVNEWTEYLKKKFDAIMAYAQTRMVEEAAVWANRLTPGGASADDIRARGRDKRQQAADQQAKNEAADRINQMAMQQQAARDKEAKKLEQKQLPQPPSPKEIRDANLDQLQSDLTKKLDEAKHAAQDAQDRRAAKARERPDMKPNVPPMAGKGAGGEELKIQTVGFSDLHKKIQEGLIASKKTETEIPKRQLTEMEKIAEQNAQVVAGIGKVWDVLDKRLTPGFQ